MSDAGAMAATEARLRTDIDDQLFTRGVQARVSVGGEVVLALADGEDGLGRPMRPDTVLRVYCTIKPITAVAVGLLVDGGALDLDRPLAELLPTYAALQGGATLRHVLTHTAGVAVPDGVAMELVAPADRTARLERQQRMAGTRLGLDAAYSEHFGWHLVGRAIEAVTGRSLHDHLTEAVLAPLGMTDTHVGMAADTYRSVLPRLGVNVDMRALQPFPMLFERTERVCRETNAAHGGYTTAADLETFYEATVRVWNGETVAGLPTPATLRTLTADARPRSYDQVLQRECAYGLGFMTSLADHWFGPAPSAAAYGHSGNVGSSFAFADPVHDLAAALVFNGVVDPDSAYLRRTSLVRAIYRDLGLDATAVAATPGDDAPPTSRRRWRRR